MGLLCSLRAVQATRAPATGTSLSGSPRALADPRTDGWGPTLKGTVECPLPTAGPWGPWDLKGVATAEDRGDQRDRGQGHRWDLWPLIHLQPVGPSWGATTPATCTPSAFTSPPAPHPAPAWIPCLSRRSLGSKSTAHPPETAQQTQAQFPARHSQGARPPSTAVAHVVPLGAWKGLVRASATTGCPVCAPAGVAPASWAPPPCVSCGNLSSNTVRFPHE